MLDPPRPIPAPGFRSHGSWLAAARVAAVPETMFCFLERLEDLALQLAEPAAHSINLIARVDLSKVSNSPLAAPAHNARVGCRKCRFPDTHLVVPCSPIPTALAHPARVQAAESSARHDHVMVVRIARVGV